MAQLSKGHTFSGGETVTAAKLNSLVDSATISNILNADVSASAAIALSKLATGALPSGITVASANLVDGTIVDADVNASAAIAGTKVSPNFGSQNVVTTGTATVGASTSAGTMRIAVGGSPVRDVVVALTAQSPMISYRNGGGAWFHAGKHPTDDAMIVSSGATTTTTELIRVTPTGDVTVAGATTLNGNLTMGDADNIVFNTTTGTKIGTAAGQKLAFYNATPVVQPASANQAALTNNTGGAADGTLAAVSGSGADTDINNNFTELHVLLNEIRTALVNLGLMKGAA